MKKILFTLFVFTLVLSSCSDDNDDKDNNGSLKGTIWGCEYTESDGYTFKSTMTFSTNTFSYEGYELSPEGTQYKFSGIGTYTYDSPNLIIIEDDETAKAIISGNKMNIIEGEWFVYEEGLVYTKK